VLDNQRQTLRHSPDSPHLRYTPPHAHLPLRDLAGSQVRRGDLRRRRGGARAVGGAGGHLRGDLPLAGLSTRLLGALDDSKRLSAEVREAIAVKLRVKALWALGETSVEGALTATGPAKRSLLVEIIDCRSREEQYETISTSAVFREN
jgi:hypothetical protein